VSIKENDSPQTLAARVLEQEHHIYPYAVALFCDGRLKMKEGQCWLDNQALEQPLRLDQ